MGTLFPLQTNIFQKLFVHSGFFLIHHAAKSVFSVHLDILRRDWLFHLTPDEICVLLSRFVKLVPHELILKLIVVSFQFLLFYEIDCFRLLLHLFFFILSYLLL